MNFYLIVAADAHNRLLSLPSAYQIAISRLKYKKWGINTNTRNRKRIQFGDKVIVYISGVRENRQCFIGSATVSSPPSKFLYNSVNNFNRFHNGVKVNPYYMELSDICHFKNFVNIRNISDKLTFIKRPEIWWNFMQAGVIRIYEKDFMLISDLGVGE